jgi:hypothetical protein
VLAAVGALAAAAAAFLALREMARQRRAAYAPDIVMTNDQITSLIDVTRPLEDYSWYRTEEARQLLGGELSIGTLRGLERWTGPKMFNLGLGPAKDVVVRWSVDTEALRRAMVSAAADYASSPPAGGSLLSEVLEDVGWKADTISEGADWSDHWPYILSANVDSRGVTAPLPPWLLELYTVTHTLAAVTDGDPFGDAPSSPLPPIRIRISFSGVDGATHLRLYLLDMSHLVFEALDSRFARIEAWPTVNCVGA